MNSYQRALLAMLTAVPLVVAGCTSSSNDNPTTSPAASTPASSPASSSTAATSSSASQAVSEQALTAALLTPSEIGPGFTAAQFTPKDNPLPCTPNDPPVETQFPSSVRVGTAASANQLGAAMSEEIRLYDDTATAQQVIALTKAGVSCRNGTLNLTGEPEDATLGQATDVAASVGADEAFALEAKVSQYNIVLVAARLGSTVVTFAFLLANGADVSKLPKPSSLVKTALAKVKSA